jgi:hypothetical protein
MGLKKALVFMGSAGTLTLYYALEFAVYKFPVNRPLLMIFTSSLD